MSIRSRTCSNLLNHGWAAKEIYGKCRICHRETTLILRQKSDLGSWIQRCVMCAAKKQKEDNNEKAN